MNRSPYGPHPRDRGRRRIRGVTGGLAVAGVAGTLVIGGGLALAAAADDEESPVATAADPGADLADGPEGTGVTPADPDVVPQTPAGRGDRPRPGGDTSRTAPDVTSGGGGTPQADSAGS